MQNTKNEEFVQKGVEVVNGMNADTNFRTIVRMREEALHERDSLMQGARQQG